MHITDYWYLLLFHIVYIVVKQRADWNLIFEKSSVHILHEYKALFSSQKELQNFSDSPSHRIFRRMHGVLNIDENKN